MKIGILIKRFEKLSNCELRIIDGILNNQQLELSLLIQDGRVGNENPDAEIIHYGGISETVYANKMLRLFRAKALLFSKHWPAFSANLGILSLDLLALTRVIGYAIKSLFMSSYKKNIEILGGVYGNNEIHGIKDQLMKVRCIY